MNEIEADPAEAPGLLVPLLAAAAFAFLAWGSIVLTRDTGRIAALWLPNAFLVAIMLRYERAGFGWFIVPSFIANAAANFTVGDDARHALGLAFCNSVEITIVVLGLHWAAGGRPDLGKLQPMAWLVLLGGIVAPATSGVIAMFVLAAPGDIVAPDVWISWVLADGLGLLVVTPILAILFHGFKHAPHLDRRTAIEWAAILLVGTAITIAVFFQNRFPLLFIATPFVMVAAFRLGTFGAAITTSIVALIASVATTMGYGPVHLVQGALATKILVLQTFLLFTFGSALPVAAAVQRLREVQKELRESRDFARSILENMREIVFRTDAEGRWTFLNPAWTQITGYTVAESLGWPTTRLLRPEDYEEAKSIYPRIVSGELDECVLRQRFTRADGDIRDVEVSVRAMRDADGRFVGTSGNIRDITEQRASVAALEASEARFRTLADAAPVGIYRAGRDGGLTYVNAAWSRITGLSESESLGHGWRNALINLAEFERKPSGSGLDRPGDTSSRELNFRTKGGRETWIRVVSAAEFDSAGERTGFIGVVADITDRKHAEIELAAREEQLKLFAENVTDAVVRMTLDGHCIFATPSVRDVLGVTPEQLVGRNMLTRFHPDDREMVLNAYLALALGEIEATTVIYRSHRSGGADDWVWLEANSKLVRDSATNAPTEVIASIRDVTRRKQLEMQRDEARQRAEAAAEAKSHFLANMSHEIRTPMNGVIGFTELLLESELDDEQRRHAQLIAESGRTMMRLLNDILDLSKIDAGRMTIVNEPFDVHHALKSALRLMSVAAERKGLALTLDLADDFPKHIVGDSLRLRQILANLIGNAIKFTEEGGVTLSARVDGDEERRGIIEVTDTGVGIAPERQAAIFDEFVQESETTTRRFGGTGLGLAISRKLAELMGGTLSLRSIPGEGTTMILTLPLVEASEPVPSTPRSAPTPAIKPSPATRRVLLAEDHDINQILATALLERLGCRVDVAANGAEAIARVDEAAARGEPYDIVLMDVQMPELDGLEATRRLRAKGYDAATLPIVALTANAYEDDIAACFAAGMQGHVAKPIQLRELQSALDRLVESGTEESAPPPPQPNDPAIERLRARYADFRTKAAAAFSAVAASEGPIAPAERNELRTLAHKLAGTAAMFGDADLGEAVRRIEDAVAGEAGDDALRAEVNLCLILLANGDEQSDPAISSG
ncbi:PAS domain S-box protein [Sphingomonas cannabina]|uniref:PAS domain S-box protein n=1 Tax=Sphingomonas cannabina TaxID=2899123 RepID=UPI001F239903|nr:PAS domain S-box protein [Sphingomonas cannabina]UIJ46633.1 PAS domain S-box protein [Sphingomonas cannabina]